MGFVVFEVETGRAVKYYRKESTAKAQVTRQNKQVIYAEQEARRLYYYPVPQAWTYCAYADYEAVLMGMSEPERKMWAFCRGGKNG